MSVFTVHEPPRRAVDAMPDLERIVFVRDGFSFWAFLFTALWMMRYRMWLVLVLYLVIAVGLENALYYAGAGTAGIVLVEFAMAVLMGMEAATLRRFALRRRGFREIGIVSGEDPEDAERRFFDSWGCATPEKPDAAPPRPSVLPAPLSHTPDVVGLFPDPGANR